jgi:putative FmdB family regulatory protein
MPIYEYRCPEGHAFELFQGFNEPIPEACEICGKGPVQRVLYPVAAHFKGSGFYSTDYGRSRKPKKESGDSGAPSSESGAGEKKTEKSAEN